MGFIWIEGLEVLYKIGIILGWMTTSYFIALIRTEHHMSLTLPHIPPLYPDERGSGRVHVKEQSTYK